MSWITIAGKGLEFSGKIIQSASFEAWIESKGQAIIEKTAQKRVISWFGKGREARNVLWNDLKLVTQSPALHATLSRLASNYPATIASVADAFEGNPSTADGKTYVAPRFTVNPLHRALLERALSSSDEFQALKGGWLLQSYFFDEFIEQLDTAFAQAGPAPDNPIRLQQNDWYVVGVDTAYDWRIDRENWRGHFLIHGSTPDLPEKAFRKTRGPAIKEQISSLDDRMGRLSREEKQRLAAPWIRMRDKMIAGRRPDDVLPLMAE